MTAPTTLSPQDLWTLIGTPGCPVVIDARTDEDFAADPRLIPSAIQRPGLDAANWAEVYAGASAVVYCDRGLKISQGAAAWLRHAGADAAALDDGFQGWRAAGLPLVPEEKLPPRDGQGRRAWVTGERPDANRLACAWLIRRFVDPQAVFLFVAPAEVAAVAERFGAAAFGGEGCRFDAMVEGFGLNTGPLRRLTDILRGAVSARPEASPEAAGLQALCLGLARMHSDDLARLEAGMGLYDALYCWARDAAAQAPSRSAIGTEG